MKRMKWAIPVLLLLFGSQAVLQTKIDPFWKKYYAPPKLSVPGLGAEQVLVALSGFREVLAGIMWVRADEFFHQGNYDAILPLVRLVTLLDSKQIDVYVTGAWHMGYNFTDEDQRSDRRYLVPALQLLREGVNNNQNTYELWFELGWMKYHKIMDYKGAVEAFEKAKNFEDIPLARRDILAHAYYKNGQISDALNYLYELLDMNQKILDDYPGNESARIGRDTVEKNLDQHIIRMAARGYFAKQRGDYGPAGHYTTLPPLEQMDFGARITVTEPGVIRVVGTLGLAPIGARVRIVLKDQSYDLHLAENEKLPFSPELPKDVTYMQDDLYNKKKRFARTINMSKDPAMYPFDAEKYDIVFSWSPRWAPASIQDRLGWNGEAMDDKRYLNIPKDDPSLRQILCTLTITKDQILQRGEWRDKKVVVETPGFVEVQEEAPKYRVVPNTPGTPGPAKST